MGKRTGYAGQDVKNDEGTEDRNAIYEWTKKLAEVESAMDGLSRLNLEGLDPARAKAIAALLNLEPQSN